MPFNTKSIIANLPRPPSREERLAAKADRMSPIQIVRTLTLLQWCYLFVGMASWTVDAVDFCASCLLLPRHSQNITED